MMRKPTVMYIHGFRSGANGSKPTELQQFFGDRYRVVAPEVDADPDKALAIIDETIRRERPEMIIGTSLGGWMAVMCDSGDAEIVIVNPAVNPAETLGQWIGAELPYFCERLDGRQTYTLTDEVVAKYRKYDFKGELEKKTRRLHAICSSNDELIGDSHIRVLGASLDPDRLLIADDFGHRCSGRGLAHLFSVLTKVIGEHDEDGQFEG